VNADINILDRKLGEQIPLRVSNGIDGRNRSCVWTYLPEVFGGHLFWDGDNKGVKAFAMLEKPVDVFVNKGRKGVRQNTSETQRAMPKLTSPLKPSDQAARRQRFARTCDERLIA